VDQPTDESGGTTTETTDNGNPDRELPQAIANRVKELEDRLRQVEEANKPQQPNRLPAQIVSAVLLMAVAVGVILFFWRRPDKSLLDGMRDVGQYIRAEDEEEQAPTETEAGAPPTTGDSQYEGADELFSIIGRVGRSLMFLITFTWLLLGAIPIGLSLLDTTVSGTFGDTFGFVNAWFSGLALAGVILAIVMQTIELRYQRKELKQTRDELARSADAAQRSQEQFTKQTEFSFLATYLGALEATAGMSPDPEGSPGYQRQRARLNTRLQTLLERLERDTLGLDLVAEAEADEATTIWAGWKQRFSDLCNSLVQHWATKRRNNGGAVGQAKEFLGVVDKQLNRLRDELDEGENMKRLARSIDDLRRQVTELANFRITDGGMIINSGGVPRSPQDAQYREFWDRGAGIIQRFQALVESVTEGRYDDRAEGAEQ